MSFSLVAEVGFEPHDLRVMSPTSYQAALLRDIFDSIKSSLGGAGDRDRTGTMLSNHGILSPGRLPVPPHRRARTEKLFALLIGSHWLLYHRDLCLSTPFSFFLIFFFIYFRSESILCSCFAFYSASSFLFLYSCKSVAYSSHLSCRIGMTGCFSSSNTSTNAGEI